MISVRFVVFFLLLALTPFSYAHDSCAPPPPPPPPPPTGDIAFQNVTTQVIDQSPGITGTHAFWSTIDDFNGDGCEDIFIGGHSDNYGTGGPPGGSSMMFVQDNVNNVCQSLFTFYDRTQTDPPQPDCQTGYSQDQACTGKSARISSRYHLWNTNSDPRLLPSIWGHDTDGSAAAVYYIDPLSVIGGNPLYQTEEKGCPGARSRCVIADINGDGALEYVTSAVSGSQKHTLKIADVVTRNITNVVVDSVPSDTHLVFDYNLDSYPDVCNFSNETGVDATRGCWMWDNNTQQFIRQASVFADPWFYNPSDTCPRNEIGRNHQNAIDCDADGDMDILVGNPVKNQSCQPNDDIFYYALYRNNGDGTYTDISVSAGLDTLNLRNQSSYSNYLGTKVADLDLDGYPDIVYGGWGGSSDTVAVVKNNGNCTFSFDSRLTTGINSGQRPWVGVGDFNNDGRPDIVFTEDSGTHLDVGLHKNITNTSGHYMRLRAVGVGANMDGLHTKVTWLIPNTNTVITTRMVMQHGQGQDDRILHAGLGAHASTDVRVTFPHDGQTCLFEDVIADKHYIVFDPRRTGQGCQIAEHVPGSAWPASP